MYLFDVVVELVGNFGQRAAREAGGWEVEFLNVVERILSTVVFVEGCVCVCRVSVHLDGLFIVEFITRMCVCVCAHARHEVNMGALQVRACSGLLFKCVQYIYLSRSASKVVVIATPKMCRGSLCS
jgi:hypothetical protein